MSRVRPIARGRAPCHCKNHSKEALQQRQTSNQSTVKRVKLNRAKKANTKRKKEKRKKEEEEQQQQQKEHKILHSKQLIQCAKAYVSDI